MVRTFSAFLDFCYIVQAEIQTEKTLLELEDALNRFHLYREIFKTTGVRLDFALPRQHSMEHYYCLIRAYGAPNGLCSSITESKHIKAVKEPWRRSNHYEAIGQMLLTNQRLDKISAMCVNFEHRGMLVGTCLANALSTAPNCQAADAAALRATPRRQVAGAAPPTILLTAPDHQTVGTAPPTTTCCQTAGAPPPHQPPLGPGRQLASGIEVHDDDATVDGPVVTSHVDLARTVGE
jgi:hypothetical protein